VLRRFFRIGLTLGALGALAAAIARALGLRGPAEPAPATAVGPLPRQAWPPLEPDPGLAEPPADTRLHLDPEAPMPTTTEVPAAPAPEQSDVVASDAAVAWVEPDGDVCPTTHPVKAKLTSKIFHVPGGLSYDRVKPDRCYPDAAAAEADGLRPAKR
jgi:hypothetical protein